MRKGHKLGVVKMFLFFSCGGEFSFVLDSAQKRFGAAAFPPGKPCKNACHPYLPLPFAHQIDRVPPLRRFIPPPQRARSRACSRHGARGVARANVQSSRGNRFIHVASTIPFACPPMPMFPKVFAASNRSRCRKATPYL